jgi:hypothetical protein
MAIRLSSSTYYKKIVRVLETGVSGFDHPRLGVGVDITEENSKAVWPITVCIGVWTT